MAARGIDLINLGIGDPDTPTPPHIVARLREAAGNPANHRYPDYEGLPSFRQAAAGWMRERYGLTVDPATEVVSLIGSKEGIANMAVAFVDHDDVVLVPDPGYPVYHIGTSFNGGVTYRLPLRRGGRGRDPIAPAAARKRYGRALLRLRQAMIDNGLLEEPS